MIRLTATALNVYGRFHFAIDGDALAIPRTAVTPAEAANILTDLGVAGSARLVAHAETWGAVDIHEHGVEPIGPGRRN